MDFIEILKKRRSVRTFIDKPVEKEKIDQLMESLRYLPSSRSIFPTEFIIVNDKGLLKKLADCRDHGASILENAPLAIVVLGNTQKSDVWVEDASIASTFLLLTAVELGLGACWVQIRKRKKGKISSDGIIGGLLNIPHSYSILSIVAIGYADEKSIKPKSKFFSLDKIYLNQYNSTY